MTVARVGIIGGTGLEGLAAATDPVPERATPFGPASAEPQRGRVGTHEVVFLARHGQPHAVPPHLVNYRANLWLLKKLGVEAVVATNAVGGIDRTLAPGHLVIPHQIIDYTWGRAHTFVEGGADSLVHVDFTEPYDTTLRANLVAAALDGEPLPVHMSGVYGCTQGPRLESAAEIDRMEDDGCTVVGMTGMPEAALARELELPYASVCLVVNDAAGRGAGPITHEAIAHAVATSGRHLVELLGRFLAC